MPPSKRTRSASHNNTSMKSEDPSSRENLSESEGAKPKKRATSKAKMNLGPRDADSGPRYFLMKAEPESRIEKGKDVKFSIDDLKVVTTEPWDGVRNAEASKTMRERMKLGDKAFFYHSNTKNPGIAGIASIAREGYPDSSAWEVDHPYFDPKTNKEKPKWYRVDVTYERHLSRFVSLKELKTGNYPELQNMQLLRRPQLSVQQVTPEEWQTILRIEKEQTDMEKPVIGNPADVAAGIEPDDEVRQQERKRGEEARAQIAETHGGSQ